MKIKQIFSKLLYFVVTFGFFVGVNSFFADLCIRNSGYSNELVSLTYVKNTGAAFSILQNSTTLLVGVSIAALILILIYVLKHLKTIKMKELFFISLLSAGVFGNLYERITLGYVRDFFDLRMFDFPVFNISDVFINLAVAALIILLIVKKN